MHNMRYACNPSPRILYPLHNVRVVLLFVGFPTSSAELGEEKMREIPFTQVQKCKLPARVQQNDAAAWVLIYTKSTPLPLTVLWAIR